MGEIAIACSRIVLVTGGRVFVSIMPREMLLIMIVGFTLIVMMSAFMAIIVSIFMIGSSIVKFFIMSRVRGWMNRAVA